MDDIISKSTKDGLCQFIRSTNNLTDSSNNDKNNIELIIISNMFFKRLIIKYFMDAFQSLRVFLIS